jgi:Ni,Fe-hydrogenase III large subunit
MLRRSSVPGVRPILGRLVRPESGQVPNNIAVRSTEISQSVRILEMIEDEFITFHAE